MMNQSEQAYMIHKQIAKSLLGLQPTVEPALKPIGKDKLKIENQKINTVERAYKSNLQL